MSHHLPWELHPDFSVERLTYIASLLKHVREETLELYEEGKDSPLSHGIRASERSRNAIIAASSLPDNEWLTIADSSLKFQYRIGTLLCRTYRGSDEDAPSRTLRDDLGHLDQLCIDFGQELNALELRWRFAVETDIDGSVLRVLLVGFNRSNDAEYSWEIPTEESWSGIVEASTDLEQAKELPAPTVGLPRDRAAKGTGNDTEKDNE